MIKLKNDICDKCGMEIELPDFDMRQPFYDYRPKLERAIFKHSWQRHREDFPPQFKSLTQFLKWLTEGQALIHKPKGQ